MLQLLGGWKITAGLALALLISFGAIYGVWKAKGLAEERLARVEGELAQAVQVNKDNEVERLKLQRQLESDRRISAEELKAANARKNTLDKVKKEHRVAPDSNDVISPYDADHFDRLRNSRNPG
jgi:hypothetical protein